MKLNVFQDTKSLVTVSSDWTDVEGRQYSGSPLVQHGDPLPLHAAVRRKTEWLECAKETSEYSVHDRG
jgi:hypothetical protein